MTDFARPKLVISKCFFEKVRYNGLGVNDSFVIQLKDHAKIITVCPEMEIGLGVPRKPIRVVEADGERKLIQPETGLDFTEAMQKFTGEFLASLKDIDGFIMKNASPSSGIKDVKIYPSAEHKSPNNRGAGFFGGAVVEQFSPLAVEDEGRLSNFTIRESFLTRIFQHADLRRVIQSGKMKNLVDFHSKNKYLLMANNQKQLKILGKIVANSQKNDFDTVCSEYEQHFNLALSNVAGRGSHINVLMHTFGYFKDELESVEKANFIDLLDLYRNATVPLIAVTTLIKSWAVKYKKDYLLMQSYFRPFPEGLISLRDSGKKVEA